MLPQSYWECCGAQVKDPLAMVEGQRWQLLAVAHNFPLALQRFVLCSMFSNSPAILGLKVLKKLLRVILFHLILLSFRSLSNWDFNYNVAATVKMEEAAVLALESCQHDNFFNFEGAIKFGSHRLLPPADAPDIPGRKSCPQCRKHLVELRQVSLTHTVSPPGVILWCPLCRLHRCLTRRGNGSNASVCLHLFCPDASDIDRSINVNVLAVVCCFSCLLIKIMQNERKAIFFF